MTCNQNPGILTPKMCEWLELLSIRDVPTNTITSYSTSLRTFANYLEKGNTRYELVNRDIVMGYLSSLQEESRYKTSSALRHISTLKSFERWRQSMGYQPVTAIETLENPRRQKILPMALSLDEALALLKADGRSLPAQLLLEVLYDCGIRASESTEIRLRHFDFERGMLKIKGKGDKHRFVPFGDPLANTVSVFLEQFPREADNFIFQRRDFIDDTVASRMPKCVLAKVAGSTGPITRKIVWQVVRQEGEKVLGKAISPVILRHSCATHLLQNGMELRMIQVLLGHADVNVTEKYLSVSRAHLKAAHRRAFSDVN